MATAWPALCQIFFGELGAASRVSHVDYVVIVNRDETVIDPPIAILASVARLWLVVGDYVIRCATRARDGAGAVGCRRGQRLGAAADRGSEAQ